MNKLANYKNGNTEVTIYDDGTKVRNYEEPVEIYFPESIDVKITNFCNLNCDFCHEMSDKKGNHADLDVLLETLKDFPPGIELAIGGGNPLSHPELVGFLQELKKRGFIPNITINQKHLKQYKNLIEKLILEKLVFGVGISINSDNFEHIKPLMKITKNIVFHMIAGVNDITEIEKLRKFDYCKILVLGYKKFGKGKEFFNEEVGKRLWLWNMFISYYLSQGILSFDNLAIEQLRLQKYVSEEEWQQYFMGDDFIFTMYIDAVKQQYAPSSVSNERKSFNDFTLFEYFQKFRNN